MDNPQLKNYKTKIGFTDRENLLVDSFRVLSADLDVDMVVKNSLGFIIKRFDADAACLFLADLHDYSVRSCCAGSADPEKVHILPFKDEHNIKGWDTASRKPVIINDIDPEDPYSKAICGYVGICPDNVIGVPLFAGGEFLGIVQAINSSEKNKFSSDDLELLEIIAERIALTLRNAWILEEAVRASDEAKSLYEVGIALSSSLELEDLLDKILENLARVMEYDIAIIYLVDPLDGTINQISTRGLADTVNERIHLKIGQGVCGRVAETGQGIIVSDVDTNSDYIALRPQTASEMAVPLKVKGSVIGVFNIESDKSEAYTRHDLELMNAFASLAAVSIERARFHQERLVARELEDELSIARRIQQTFLPAESPSIPGFDLAGVNIPSAEVGGDYYDFIPIVDNQFGIAIGDVAGKGIPASLIMAAFRASLKAEIRNNFAIRAILQKVNNLLFESIERDRYVTAVYGVLDSKNRIFTFSNAGHNPPIIIRSAGGVEYLKEGGLALGIFAESAYEERSIFLAPGDTMIFYTDGVTEANNSDGIEFGEKRLLKILLESRKLPARDIIDNIVKDVGSFGADGDNHDDLTIIVLKAL